MAVVVGIVKGCAVRLNESRAANGVIKNALHAIAVTRVARRAQQIARNLKMAIGSARRLETGMRAFKACRKGASSRLYKRFVWSPPSGRVALLLDHPKTILRRTQVLFLAENEIRLHRGTQRIYVAVGVLAGKNVIVFRKGIEVILLEKTNRHISIAPVSSATLISKEEVFR